MSFKKEFEEHMSEIKTQLVVLGAGPGGYAVMGGLLVGIFTDNIGLWISLGLVFGVVLEKNNNKSDKEQQDE